MWYRLNLWLRWVYLKALSVWIKIVLKNTKCKPCFCVYLYLEVGLEHSFQTPSETSIKGLRVRYAELYWLYLKAPSIGNRIVLKDAKCKSCFGTFNWKLYFSTSLLVSFLDTFRDEYKGNKSEICRIYNFTGYI